MPRRRPLALLATVAVAVLSLLVVSARPARPATSPAYVALGVVPSCGAASSTTGSSVRLTATSLAPGPSAVTIGGPDGADGPGAAVGTVVVSPDGSLDQSVTLPPLAGAGLYEVAVRDGALGTAIGYFSIPCPTLSVEPACGPADDASGSRYSLMVSGAGYGPPSSNLPVRIELDGSEVPGSPAQVASDGTFHAAVTPSLVAAGAHTLRAYQTTADEPQPLARVEFREATTTLTVPCAPPPTPTTPTDQTVPPPPPTNVAPPPGPVTLELAPPCRDPGVSGTTRLQLTGGGFAEGPLEVVVDGGTATSAVAAADGSFAAEVELAPGRAADTIVARQGSRRASATFHVPCASQPALTVNPAVGPPGLVTHASGAGFPPGVRVRLSWTVGIGITVVRADANGTFQASVLIFPGDQTGPRALRAMPLGGGRFTELQVDFLCVPGTEQPRSFEVRR